MKTFIVSLAVFFLFQSFAVAQRPVAAPKNTEADLLLRVAKAEDARDFAALGDLPGHAMVSIRKRAILAAGRIGDRRAIPVLVQRMGDESTEIWAMAAFAIGEIESIDGADAILSVIRNKETSPLVRAMAVEAAGKIAAANNKHEKAKPLGEAVIDALNGEVSLAAKQDRNVILAGLTALLRARPEKADLAAAKFLSNSDPRIRADAANTLSRLRAKNANVALRQMLAKDTDGTVRANAARALGAAEDKEALEILVQAATSDPDSRVRVTATRSLASLKDEKAALRLLDHFEKLLSGYKKSKFRNPVEKSEMMELCITLGRLLTNTDNARAVSLIREFAILDDAVSPEISIARLRISQEKGEGGFPQPVTWRQYVTLAQMIGEFATLEPVTENGKKLKSEAPGVLRDLAVAFSVADPKTEGPIILAAPDVLRSYAKFKTDDLTDILLDGLKNQDLYIRATSASLISEQPTSQQIADALAAAFAKSLETDPENNDAQLALLDALFKVNKTGSVEALTKALNAPDHLVRKKAFDLLDDKDFKSNPSVQAALQTARSKNKEKVVPHLPNQKTKLGQITYRDADYRRALARKNGSVSAVLTTEKGNFTIDFFPEEAPVTVDNFVTLARSGYFNGLEVHRVVANFVMQDGDPLGNGSGGPGWSIRCEVNTVPFERGVVGMALSGKDTGGSQWFVTHAPQPHLDGGYTVFGQVNETGMKVVDNIVRGDRILSVKIIGR